MGGAERKRTEKTESCAGREETKFVEAAQRRG